MTALADRIAREDESDRLALLRKGDFTMLTYEQICERADEVRRDSGKAVRPGPGKF